MKLLRFDDAGKPRLGVLRGDPPCSPRATPTLAVVAAIAHHLRTGGAWRDLPPWFPNWRTVYGRFRRWTAMGSFDEAKGFEPVFKRWLVERSFGALRHRGGLLVDRAGSIDVSTGRLACVAAMAGLEAPINPMSAKMTTD